MGNISTDNVNISKQTDSSNKLSKKPLKAIFSVAEDNSSIGELKSEGYTGKLSFGSRTLARKKSNSQSQNLSREQIIKMTVNSYFE